MSERERKIAHLFADHAVESEALSVHGSVVRFTIDPNQTPFVDETVEMDLMDQTPSGRFDFALLHPRCTDVSDMTSIDGDAEDHDNQILRARDLATRIADDWVIENKPRPELRDATVLNGRMFGLPVDYERAFEASFRIRQPPRDRSLGEKTVTPYFYSDRSAEWWAAVKGYRGDYPKQHLAKNAVPIQYIHHVLRSWLESRGDRDAETPQDNNNRPPRRQGQHQTKLTSVQNGT